MAAKNKSMKIRIKLKSHDSRLIDKATTAIVDTAKKTGAKMHGQSLCQLRLSV